MSSATAMNSISNIPKVINVANGSVTDLTSIWGDRKCIVCFLRHFNCRFCQQQIADLNQIHTYLTTHYNNKCDDNEKIHVVAIGVSATLKEAQIFQESNKYLGELYVDETSHNLAIKVMDAQTDYATTAPAYDMMRLFDAKSNIYDASGTSFRPEVAELAQKALDDGFVDGDISNKPKQLFLRVGGCFVLGAGNTCDYAYRSKYAGDHAPISDVLKAAIGGTFKEDDIVESYTYPSTKKWAKDLNVGKKSVPKTTCDGDAKYLKSLRIDQEQRLKQNASVKSKHTDKYESMPYLVVLVVVFLIFCNIAYPLQMNYILNHYVHATYIACLFAVVLCVFVGVKQLKKQKSLKCPFSGAGMMNVKLLTLKDIDRIAVKSGEVNCDCGFVQTQDVSHKSEDVRELTKTEHDSNTSPEELKSLLKTCCYLREFLAKPHPLVGRKGPVCPFVPGSLRMNAMYLSVLKNKTTFEEVEKIARSFVNRFHSLEPKTGRKAAYKAVVLVFPDIALSDAHDIIDKVQLKLKPEFVAKGLMIGEFHRNNNACMYSNCIFAYSTRNLFVFACLGGLRNDNFYPLRTPIPSLAIRCIVPTDLVFLSPSKYDAKLRVEFLKIHEIPKAPTILPL